MRRSKEIAASWSGVKPCGAVKTAIFSAFLKMTDKRAWKL